jgi:hypothetical protein
MVTCFQKVSCLNSKKYTRDPKLVYLGSLFLTRAPSSTRPEPVEAYGCMKRYHPNIIHLYCPNHATKVGGEETEAKLSKQSSESFRRFGTHRCRKSHRIHTHTHTLTYLSLSYCSIRPSIHSFQDGARGRCSCSSHFSTCGIELRS